MLSGIAMWGAAMYSADAAGGHGPVDGYGVVDDYGMADAR
jgi:hypothetical protein